MINQTDTPESDLLAELARLLEETEEGATPGAITTGMFCRMFNVSKTTAKSKLGKLADAGLLRREKVYIINDWGYRQLLPGYLLVDNGGALSNL